MMEITKEMMLERKASLEADMFAINGAIQQCDWVLARIDEDGEPGKIESSDILIEE
jgi:hypothetical protein